MVVSVHSEYTKHSGARDLLLMSVHDKKTLLQLVAATTEILEPTVSKTRLWSFVQDICSPWDVHRSIITSSDHTQNSCTPVKSR